MSHCNKSECLTTKRLGKCDCFCLECNQPANERTTLDIQREKNHLTPPITQAIRLIRLALHADDCERATILIDELAEQLGLC